MPNKETPMTAIAKPTASSPGPAGKGVTLHRWDDIPREPVTETISRRLVTGERMMLAHVYLAKGAIVPRHSHDNEQLTYILEGALKFWIGEDGAQELIVRAGEVLVIPSNVPHKAEALEDTLDVDVFSPPRQDWLDGTDHYFRQK
jgi:quercetin dioxygenase-like cupin family protein